MSVINPVINLRLSRRESTFPLGSCLRLQPAELQVQFLAKGHCGKLLKKGESDTEILFCKSKWEGDEPQLETFGVCVCSVIRGEQHSSAEIKFPELTLTISITSGHMHTHTHARESGVFGKKAGVTTFSFTENINIDSMPTADISTASNPHQSNQSLRPSSIFLSSSLPLIFWKVCSWLLFI